MLHRAGFSTALLFFLLFRAQADSGKPKEGPKKSPPPAVKTEELTLEKLFPKRGLFGPSAFGMAFSHDGKYAAFLYRPHTEQRHGSDLWLLDVATGKTKRITTAAKMAKYQASARAVVAENKKEKKENKKEKKENKKKQEKKEKKRYSGISSFTWSPVAAELLFTSEGDIYRWKVGDDMPTRLTMTRAIEKGVRYLPDGRGYTCLRDTALVRVIFGSDLHEQIDPKLPEGEYLWHYYRISPDGKHLAFVSYKAGTPDKSRKVAIASYRERFMKVNEVSRRVSEDPQPPTELKVYLHDLSEPMVENGNLSPVFSHKYSGPRDILTQLEWSPDSRKIAFAVFQQTSAEVRVLTAELAPDPKKGAKREAAKPAKVVHRFTHTGGPNTPSMMRPRFLADSRHLVLLTEVSGFRHLHVLDPLYESLDQATFGRCEVYPVALSRDRKYFYVTATREHPSRLDVYRVDLVERKMERLTSGEGVYESVAVSPDGKVLLANFARFGTPKELVLAKGSATQETLTDSHPALARRLAGRRPEFFTYKNRHGHDIHGFLFKPNNWTKADKRPLLIYVYGGPLGTRKQVTEGNYHSDAYFFQRYMAEKHGYVTCVIDPRGMSGYGGSFEKANFEQVGKPQVEDLADGVKYLVANCGVDQRRVGIHGWSFGGFQTQMCLYTEPDVFAVGIAGAGPTEWENYNAWYSTATIGLSRLGMADLAKFSLLPLAKKLKGKLMLVHGMEDSNVLYQDTVRVYRELLKAGKETQVELFLDPTGGHGLGGDVSRLARARKYEDFLVRYLGKGAPILTGPIASRGGKPSLRSADTTPAPSPQR